MLALARALIIYKVSCAMCVRWAGLCKVAGWLVMAWLADSLCGLCKLGWALVMAVLAVALAVLGAGPY